MPQNTKKPQLRFKGFTDDWEQRKLGEVAKYKNGKAHENYILDSGRYIVVNSKFVSTEGNICKYSNKQIEPLYINDIAFVLSDIPNGRALARTYLVEKNDRYTLNQRIAGISPNEVAWPYYLYILMNRNKYFLQFDDGVKQTNLSFNDVMGFEEYYPSFSEQKKIGKYFEKIDNFITLHQRKLEKLKNVKKSMLEKMFPKNGSNVPEIRFKGFTDDWGQRKLSSLCEKFTDGDWIEAKDQSDSGIRLIQTGNIGTTEYLDKINNAKWISEETFERLHCEEIFEGDILISRLPEPAGRACIIPDLGTKMITAVDCTIVRKNSEVISEYLVQYLSTPKYFKEINTLLGGGTRQRISRGNLAEIVVPIPIKIKEQKKIGGYFSYLDNLITLHQRKLEKLQNIKKACLEKMFV